MKRVYFFALSALALLCLQCYIPDHEYKKQIHPWVVYEEGFSFEDIVPVKEMIGSVSIFGDPPKSFLEECHRNDIEVYKAVVGKGHDIDTPEERENLYVQYMDYCTDGYDGIDFDFEGLDAGLQELYSKFLTEASARIHSAGKKVSHCVGFYPNMYKGENPEMFYDPEVLAEVCDYVRVMCYDMYWAPGNTGNGAASYLGPTSNYPWAEMAMRYWMDRIPESKLIMALPAYGNDYALVNGLKGRQIYAPEPDRVKGELPPPVWLYYEKLNIYLYDNVDGTKHIFYASDEKSTEALLDLAEELDVHNIGFWNYNSVSDEMWREVQEWYEN